MSRRKPKNATNAKTANAKPSPPQPAPALQPAAPPPPKFDVAWLGVVPVIGWALAYAHEAGYFSKNDVPLAFIELSLTQVIKAAFTLLVTGLVFGQWVEAVAQSKSRVRTTIVLILVYISTAGLALKFLPDGLTSQALRFLAAIGLILGTVLVCAWAHKLIGWRLMDTLRVFDSPTLTGVLNLLTWIFVLCALAWIVGYQRLNIFRPSPVVIDSGCGPVPQLISRSGDAFIFKLPSAGSEPPSFQLLPVTDAKTQRFRTSNALEIQFRNESFNGPCSAVGGK
ncbi:hypothetical protein [Achromobacter sp. ACRQX]|uniref:hypothetical protein n=1 Tax=Achromobacter sp. ACRQX TaxID=2918181 RepID=UPI001EF2D632|nr:hypothetical protein [Achromobacter sp. ACRQX]MCG7326855.1 hypothetical protein [Achromobacter sp. ACRQX]